MAVTPTQPPTASPAMTATPTQAFDVSALCAAPTAVSLSPDGAWAAIDCHETASLLTVLGLNGSRWAVGGETLARSFSLNRTALCWSPDGRFLYFAETTWRAYNDPEGYAQIGSIHRLTLATGDQVALVISVNDMPAFAAAIDPTGAHLAWVNAASPQLLTLIDLRSFDTHKLTLAPELVTAGDVTWSPEGDRLALSAVKANGGGALVMIEPDTKTAVTLPTPDDRVMRIKAWTPDGAILLRDEAWPDPGVWTLNLTTGTFVRQTTDDPP
jgi:Tol biopolymer transport system component